MVERIGSSLVAGGFKVTRDSVAGRQAVIGRKPALRSPTFVLVAVFKADATTAHLDRFLDEAAQYARTVGGRLRIGGRAGLDVVAVAVVDSTRDVGDWGQSRAGPRPSVYPVLVDLAAQRVTQPQHGAPGLQQLVRAHVVPALAPPAAS